MEHAPEHTPFKLADGFEPARDQPQAIEKLVEGVNDGLAHQTLLGVTGSGKSVGHNEPLLIAEFKSGEMCTRLVKAGPFIDAMMKSSGLDSSEGADTERFGPADPAVLTPAYDPQRGTTAWFPVAALLRHRAPPQMYRLCSRRRPGIDCTGDSHFL